MKRVSIITIIDNNNFGTFLQAFALCNAIEFLGHKPELADYCRPHMKPLTAWWNMCKEVKNPLRILSRTRGLLLSHKLHKKDRKFISRYLSGKTCYSSLELQENLTGADVYMTGSDQVWNSIHNRGLDRAFYLDYASPTAKRVAYAASIGMPEFRDWERLETKWLLERYVHITLREKSAIDLLGSLGLNKERLKAVLDPTLLLNKSQWLEHIKLPRLHNEKYLLVYSVETKRQDAVIDEVARIVAQKKGLKIVGVYYGTAYNRISCCDYNHFRATPDIFLSLMYYADFVVVSSFHGTSFSINFQKDFYTVMPDRFNARVANILSITHLENRLIENSKQIFDTLSQPIDWNRVSTFVESERNDSLSTLKHIIEQ